MLRPRALNRGDKIALLTPAGPARQSGSIRSAAEAMEELGFVVVLSPWIADSWRYLAGSDESRIEELHWAFEEDAIRGIICFRGGYGSLRLLPGVDWNIIREHPKVFVGMSDITALQIAAFQKIGLITFAGPMPALAGFGEFTPFSRASLLAAITGNGLYPLVLKEGPADPTPIILSGGVSSGILIGGNLHTLVSMIGTPFQVSFDGAILVFEEVNEAPYRVDRMITQLLLGGHLDKVHGIALARFHGCYETSEEEIVEVLEERLRILGIPILYGLALGHQQDVMTWPQGCTGVIDCEAGFVSVREPGVVFESAL